MHKFLSNLFKPKYIPDDFKGDLCPSPHDPRDYALSSVSPAIQRYPEVCPRPFDLSILNQQQEPSCVGFSCAGIKQYMELREKISKFFDGSWIYGECKKIDGMPNFPGTYLRSGLEVLRNVGAKPIGESDPTPYRIKVYARVDDNSFEGLKKAIFLYGTVLAGFRGSNPGWRSEIIRPPQAGEIQWGHAVFLTSYEKDYLIGQNSWGEKAHNNGLFKVPKNYLPFESWVVVLDEETTLSPEPIKTAWVASNWIQESNGVWTTTANLNAREDAGLSHKAIKLLPKGTKLNIVYSARKSADGYWWQEIVL